MFEREFTVRYVTLKKCFCYLSQNSLKELQGNLIKLGYGNGRTAYFSVDAPLISIGDRNIGINSLYAKSLGIEDNEIITVSKIDKLPSVESFTIAPVKKDDYEVLEMLAENVQSTLLNQVRILNSGQKLVIWIGSSLNVTVDISNVKPQSPGRIDNLTEVVVKPTEGKSSQIKTDESKSGGFTSFFNYFINRKETNTRIEAPIDIFKKFQRSDDLILRAVPSSSIRDKIDLFHHPFNIFVFDKNQEVRSQTRIYCAKFLNDDDDLKSIYVMLHLITDYPDEFDDVSRGYAFLSDDLFGYFQCDIGERFLLEPYVKPPPVVEKIDICTSRYKGNIVEEIKIYLAHWCEKGEFILNNDFVLKIDEKFHAVMKFENNVPFCLINPDFVRNCTFSVVLNEDLPTLQHKVPIKTKLGSEIVTSVGNFKSILESSLFEFTKSAKITGRLENILITGKSGTGKSTLLKIINEELVKFPHFFHTFTLDCKSMKGKTVESLHKQLTTILFELIHHQPSVLILDDFDIICENIGESDVQALNAIHFNKISEMLEGLFRVFTEYNSIGIIASAESTAKLNKNIYGTRGHHFFKSINSIDNLDKNDRKVILRNIFASHGAEVDLETLGERTESFALSDLVDFANKSLFESFQSKPENSEVFSVSLADCERAFEQTSITSLQGIAPNSAGSKDFTDIGGLHEVKTTLIETLLWPSKYPDLFADAPLRMPSGLLLYGPPGTGKTLLAGAAAKQCGLRLISIKGPELLSKYIGASEQAVRDVFQKAQSAKPCVLFFDEFDSLAPRRGHDNTGVTDRVVNQLLTQLDGVESLCGVFVIAATSRPDLLDPALLRPGRLDRHILCALPDEESRLEILISLSKLLQFDLDVDLAKIAGSSAGFSGADLQSLLYSAQVATVEDLLLDDDDDDGIKGDEGLQQRETSVINQSQLEEALAKTRPSLTQQEKHKYDRIYRKFQEGTVEDHAGSRATLA